MQALLACLAGGFTAAAAVLLHQTLPPLGLIVGLTGTSLSIWWIGRHFGAKRYKRYAVFGWLLVIYQAGTFGTGHELLIQNDGVGSTLLFLGFISAVITSFLPL